MLIDCMIHFEVLRNGRSSAASIGKWLDTADALKPQALAEIADWIDRKARICHQRYSLVEIRDIHYCVDGKICCNSTDWVAGLADNAAATSGSPLPGNE